MMAWSSSIVKEDLKDGTFYKYKTYLILMKKQGNLLWYFKPIGSRWVSITQVRHVRLGRLAKLVRQVGGSENIATVVKFEVQWY
jgi:hypothetical protein